jgi:cyanophycin synthetase
MRILRVQTLRGPNYWSIRYGKLIVMRLDLEDLAHKRSSDLPGFYEALKETLPSLDEHKCSRGYRGGFLERLKEGTLMGHIVEHVALELQQLAQMPVRFGRTRETSEPGVYQVVFQYVYEKAGRYAGRAAVRMCQSIVDTGRYPQSELKQDLQDLDELRQEAALGPSTETIIRAAEARGIPWMPLKARSMVQLGYGIYQKRLQATLTDTSSILGVELACDKEGTKRILAEAGIPVPRGTVIHYFEDLEDAVEEVGSFPVAIKPLDGNHGRGITINIDNMEEAEAAYDQAKEASKTRSILVESFHFGSDHRILVVNGKVIAVSERVPAHVVGDGQSTITELIEETNRDPRRGEGHDNVLTKLKVDRTSTSILEKQGYTLDSIPPEGQVCYLRATANLSTGGIAIDRTDQIHPENIWLAERVAKLIGLDIAGIDVVTQDISKPLREVDGVVIEVNAAPGFRMHACPSHGQARNVGGAVVDMMFPPGTPCQIPIISITGTNGKTTTTRLIAHMMKQTQKTVGYTTTDGTYIGNWLVEPGDNTGPQSAHLILRDPTVEVAVLETARGGILRSGLAFESCDVGVVLNVSADHLGIGDINTIEQMADLKAVVAEAVHRNGYAILNADDFRVAKMAEKVLGKVIFFSRHLDSEIIQNSVANGGTAVVYENGYLSILQPPAPPGEENQLLRIEKVENIPLTMGGKAGFMIENALAACGAAYVQGVTWEQMRLGLTTFRASTSQTPGRMNLFDLGKFHALVDYAHNPASYQAVGEFVRSWSGQRIGVVGAPGDRRDGDFIELGHLSAQIFDWILVKEDDDTRGRDRGEVADLICQGIREENPDAKYESILEETRAIEVALDEASEGSLVVILPESVRRAIDLIEKRKPLPEGLTQSLDKN